MSNEKERDTKNEADSLSDEELEQVAGGIVGGCTPVDPWINKPQPIPTDETGTILPS